MFNRLSLPRIVPFVLYLAFLAIGDALASAGWSADQLRYLYVIKTGVVLAALYGYRRHYTELLPVHLPARQAALAVLVGLLVFVLWITLTVSWMTIGTSTGYDPRVNGAIDWPLALIRAAGAALVVPVMEELFWRSFLLRWLQRQDFLQVNPAHVKITAIIVTVILFGIEHQLWLAGMVAGAAYTGLYMRSKSLWSPILAHAVTNGTLAIWVLLTGQWAFW
ncbi:hypothetical protein SAMN05192549_10951 [Duganella sacchari]|uniref:CAAX prenyl protease 2/Lysostaphin resistance protein A-like domain-containing protein n=1 Tax=Duganella sacchari TaxID=551987 RepID=A0A1M7R127_9BURK|nr:CAAX prenyl protease-related protein [Duganella sacchari]SHN38084.1 hypothetical protein SAMN05192549_10951 [Duganella sacchari]